MKFICLHHVFLSRKDVAVPIPHYPEKSKLLVTPKVVDFCAVHSSEIGILYKG